MVQLLEWIQQYNSTENSAHEFRHPLAIQIHNVFAKLLEYNYKLSQKKHKWKQLY